MAKVKFVCDCGNKIDMLIGQSVVYGGVLVWSGSVDCPFCGTKLEMDGGHDIPENYRNAILEEEGRWALEVQDGSDKFVLMLYVLRQITSITLQEIRNQKISLPGVIAMGTFSEMQYLKLKMASKEIRCAVIEWL